MKKVAIIQSNYIPWKGYFDIMNMVDEFILLDDVQYTKRDWRNRNRIKTPQGPVWLTIPVDIKGKRFQAIKDTRIADRAWGKKHWASIRLNYARAKYFKEYGCGFEELYLTINEEYLSRINLAFMELVRKILGIKTSISSSTDCRVREGRNERLIDLCKIHNATEYVSGPLAEGYLRKECFENEGIQVSWMNYDNYPEYSQLYPPFDHHVSIIDLILNEGPNAAGYMKTFGWLK